MNRTFRITEDSARLADWVREQGKLDLDALVSKLIPYGLYRKHPVDIAHLFFQNARRDFFVSEAEKQLGRKMTDPEIRDLIIADFGYSMRQEFEIEVSLDSTVSRAACVRMESDSWFVTLEDIVAQGCSDMEDLPLVEVFRAYEAPDGDLFEELPEGAEPESFREVWAADIFFCRGARPNYLAEIGKLNDIPECRSYDYILPELYEDGDEEDGGDQNDGDEKNGIIGDLNAGDTE